MADMRNFGYYSAVLFNAMFAILSSVTLIGIVFITKPQQVMHNIPPSWWVPLMLLMVPSQVASQCLTWKTVSRREVPTPLAISQNQPRIPFLFRPVIALVWAATFFIGVVILISLLKPDPGIKLEMWELLILAFITFSLTTFANVYLMLWVRTATDNEEFIEHVWKLRIVIDVFVAVAAIIYYTIVV